MGQNIGILYGYVKKKTFSAKTFESVSEHRQNLNYTYRPDNMKQT